MDPTMRISRSVDFINTDQESGLSHSDLDETSRPNGSPSDFRRESLVLTDMMQNRTMLHFFQKFLEQEYSEENLLFYLEVERFRVLTTQEDLQAKAVELYQLYVDPTSAPSLINLTQETVAQIQLRLDPVFEARKPPMSPLEEKDVDKEKKKAGNSNGGSARYDSLSIRLKKSLAEFPSHIDTSGSGTLLLVTKDLFDQAATEQPTEENSHRGVLRRRAGFFSAWKAFLYVLKGVSLFEYKEDAVPKKDNPLRVIRLKNVLVRSAEEMTGKVNSFGLFVADEKRAYFFQAPSLEEKNTWLTSLGAKVTEFAPISPAEVTCKPELLKDVPVLQHLEIFKECVLVINETNTIVSANKSTCKTFGYEITDLIDQPINLLFSEPINPDQLVQDGVTHELDAKPHNDVIPFTALVTLGRLQKGHLLVTITPKASSPSMSSLKDVGKTFSSYF